MWAEFCPVFFRVVGLSGEGCRNWAVEKMDIGMMAIGKMADDKMTIDKMDVGITADKILTILKT